MESQTKADASRGEAEALLAGSIIPVDKPARKNYWFLSQGVPRLLFVHYDAWVQQDA